MQHNRQPDERRAGEKAWKKPVHAEGENIQQPTTNTEHPMFGIRARVHWMLDVRCWLLDVPK
jgi:hypothetical protein